MVFLCLLSIDLLYLINKCKVLENIYYSQREANYYPEAIINSLGQRNIPGQLSPDPVNLTNIDIRVKKNI